MSDEARLDRAVAGVRRHVLLRTAGALALWTGAAAAAVLAGAWLLAGADGWSGRSVLPLVLDVALAATAAGAVLAYRRWSLGRLGERPVARAMDRAAGLGDGSVLGALEVARRTPVGVSGALVRRAEETVLGSLPPSPRLVREAGGEASARWAKRGAAALFVAGAAAAALALAAPERARAAWGALLSPGAALVGPELPPLRVSPGSGELPRGSDLVVRVEAPGRERVTVRWQFAGDVARSRESEVRDGHARIDLGTLSAPVEFGAQAPDGARSERVRITPLDPLLVTDLLVEFRYPPHTGRGSESFRREVPPMELPAGTRVRVDGRASRALSAAGLAVGADSAAVALEVDGRRFSGGWAPTRSGAYAWRLRDRDGRIPDTAPPPLELTLVPDSAPSVALLEPGRDTLLPLDRRQPLVIRARDDHGVASVEVQAWRVDAFGDRGEPVVQSIQAGGVRGAVARPLLDVRGWELLPGDEVRYKARALDNAPRPRSTETRAYALRVPRRSEQGREVETRLQDAAQAVDSLRHEAERGARETRELERRGVERGDRADGGAGDRARPEPGAGPDPDEASDPVSFEAREELREAAERRAQLLSRADSLRQALAELEDDARESRLGEADLEADLKELQALMEEVADAEARERMEELARSVDEMDAGDMEQALDEMVSGQDELRERLERSLERFRRAAAEQSFRATAQEAREMARDQEALADAMAAADSIGSEAPGEGGGGPHAEEEEEGASPDEAGHQEELARQAEAMEERMEELEDRLTRLGEQRARQGVQEARQRMKAAGESMSRAAQQGRQGQRSSASREARDAAGELQEAADGLDRARNRMAQRMDEAVGEALREAGAEALALARRQGDLRDRMRGADASEAAALRGDEADLLQGIRNLAGSVGGAAAMAPGVGRQVLDAVARAAGSVSEALNAMENPRAVGSSPAAAAAAAIRALNRTALLAAGGMGQQGGGQGASGGQQQLVEQVQSVARQQGDLTDRTSRLTPRRMGRAPGEEQVREVAGEQETVARRLQELARRARQDPGQEILGDLEGLSGQAREVAERLSGGRLDAETLRRQERLFHRLLDAGRSLEKDEEARERESRTAGALEARDVEALDEEARGGLRFGVPGAEVLRALTPAQRALVVRYFERLNRESPRGGGR